MDTELKSVLNLSLFNLNNTMSVDSWARTTLKRNIESEVSDWIQKSKIHNETSSLENNCCSNTNNTDGFRVTFGIQIQIDYKIRFKSHIDLGYGFNIGNNSIATTSLHLAVQNEGIGNGVGMNNLVVDLTAVANLTVGTGKGEGTPLQSYAINYNSPIPMLNDFKNSVNFGQAFTWNSALNENQFSIDRLQREGLFGFRIGNANISTSNDTKRFPYFGGGTDKGYTGTLIINTPLFETGFVDFTGDFEEGDEKNQTVEYKKEQLDNEIKKIENDLRYTKEEKEKLITPKKKEREELKQDNFHTQTPYQKGLNKATTYIRFNTVNGNSATIDFIGSGWLQDFIHAHTNNFKFNYKYYKTEIWLRKTF
jgi:hypothetical protein